MWLLWRTLISTRTSSIIYIHLIISLDCQVWYYSRFIIGSLQLSQHNKSSLIITRTPYRLSLFGGGTDYPDWYSLNPCRIVSASMQHYCYITVRDLPPFFSHTSRVVYSKVEEVSFHREIQHGGVRACLDYLSINAGICSMPLVWWFIKW